MFAAKRGTQPAPGRGKRKMRSMGNGLAYKTPAVDSVGGTFGQGQADGR
jgi:hypothetical protein